MLIDFGLSHHNQLPDLLQEEFRLPYGTAPYMAPERLLGVRDDPRSDLFSLGVLLYFFTTGERPFGESETLRGMRRRLWRDPYPPRKLKADYPPWLQEIVLRCLEIEPVWRHPTASQLAFDLAHPDQVKLTARSERLRRDPLTTVWRRRFNRSDDPAEAEIGCRGPTGFGARSWWLRSTSRKDQDRSTNICARPPRNCWRPCRPRGSPACNVLKLGRITIDRTLDEQGNNKHIDRLVALRHWASPLELDESRLTVHVLEAVDPAAAILEFTGVNQVDHIVIGARQNSMLRTLLGSVSVEGGGGSRLHGDRGAAAKVLAGRSQPANAASRRQCAQSRVWTGGNDGFAGTRRRRCAAPPSLREVATRALAVGAASPGPMASALAPRTPSFEACLRCRDDRDRSNPQDRDIEGPAV